MDYYEEDSFIMDQNFIKDRIGQLVADSGKSEKQISLDLGHSVGYIQSLTSGKSMPSIQMVFQICEYFDIPITDFFDPDIHHPLTMQKIRSYICQMNSDDLAILERLSKRLCSTGEAKENGNNESENIHVQNDPCNGKWCIFSPDRSTKSNHEK